jgi:RsiW-degrading membrane proteinase PrsW (M82 family)
MARRMVLGLAILASLVPALFWLVFFYSRDRYEREPVSLVVRLFLWGMIAGPWASGVNVLLIDLFAPAVDSVYVAGSLVLAAALLFFMVALAALNEETIKYVVASSRVRGDPSFNEPVDGVIYMTMVALGFAAGENFVYILNSYFGVLSEVARTGGDVSAAVGRAYVDAFLITAPVRALLSTVGHVAWSGMIGYYLAQHVLHKASGRTLVLGILMAAGLHTAFNFAMFLAALGIGVAWIAWIVWIFSVERYLTLYGRALSASPFRRARRGTFEGVPARWRRDHYLRMLAIAAVGIAAVALSAAAGLPEEVGLTATFLAVMGLILHNRLSWRCPACGAYLGRQLAPAACPTCKVPLGRTSAR